LVVRGFLPHAHSKFSNVIAEQSRQDSYRDGDAGKRNPGQVGGPERFDAADDGKHAAVDGEQQVIAAFLAILV
jgi:hypothetical protein